MNVLTWLILALAMFGFGGHEATSPIAPPAAHESTPKATPKTTPKRSYDNLVHITTRVGTLIIDRDGKMILCDVVAASLPPQCGLVRAGEKIFALDVQDLDISGLPGKQANRGITWFDQISVTGQLDGAVLRATEPPRTVTPH